MAPTTRSRSNPPTAHQNAKASSTAAPPQPPPLEREPVFEMVVLGSGGGPLETDCSGYLVKPYANRWEDGVLSLEGGSGIGALANILKVHSHKDVFPTVDFPETHNSPVLQAAYIFSFLTCYLISHAHLDHAVSLILLSGSVPSKHTCGSGGSRPSDKTVQQLNESDQTAPPLPTRIPVYATQETLDNLAGAYGGGLWPELGAWATPEESTPPGRRKRRRKEDAEHGGVGAKFFPLRHDPDATHSHLHASLPISTLVFPVAHGETSQGPYSSSAVFIRYDPSLTMSRPVSRAASQSALSTPMDELEHGHNNGTLEGPAGREFLFWGDVESSWRPDHELDVNPEGAQKADSLNRAIWAQAASSFNEGRLAGVFLECSYESTRPSAIMFGHLSPPAVMHELQILASLVGGGNRPLEGLRIFITHVKEFLAPHKSGKTAREVIKNELEELENQAQLGVTFTVVAPGDRLLI